MSKIEEPNIVKDQVNGLLQLLDEHRDQRCSAHLERANKQAAELLTSTRGLARKRFHQAVQQERITAQKKMATAQAELDDRCRQHQYRATLALLRRCWSQLHNTICRRWADPKARLLWINGALTQAYQALPVAPWKIEHPESWNKNEIEKHLASISKHCGCNPSFTANHALTAGIRIYADSVCIDASTEGLVADRERVESRLLILLNESL